MKKTAPILAALVSILTIMGPVVRNDGAKAAPQSALANAGAIATQVIVEAANAFLGTLTTEQRNAVQFGFAPKKAATIALRPHRRTTARPQGQAGRRGRCREKATRRPRHGTSRRLCWREAW